MRSRAQSSFSDLLTNWAKETPEDVVFWGSSGEISIAGFLRECEKSLGWLVHKGVARGDVVAIYAVSRIEWLALFFAAAQLGAVILPINTRYRSEEITYLIKKSKVRFLIAQTAFKKINFVDVLKTIDFKDIPSLQEIVFIEDNHTGMVPALPGVKTSWLDFNKTAPIELNAEINPDGLLALFATSGTTSGPKLVMQSQTSLVNHAYHCAKAYKLHEKDSVLLAQLPLCGVFGLCSVLAAMAARCPIVLMDNFEAKQAAQWINQYKVTHTFGSDEMVRRLYELAPEAKPYPSLELFGFGAFTTSFDAIALEVCGKGIPLHGLYGSSEVLAIFSTQSSSLPVEERIKGGGVPVAGSLAKFRIRDVDTGAILDANQPGEIEVIAPSMFMGYFNDQAATDNVLLRDGYFRTGDVGFLRADGSLVYLSRKGDAIRLAGFLVNPIEIEDTLKQFKGVLDTQVVAVDIAGVAKVVAFVIADQNIVCNEQDLIEQAKNVMAAFKVPANVFFVNEYPVTQGSNGMKIQKGKLRDMALKNLGLQ
ncbi:MAG: AMP-binding protein [Alcaligenaceae bacterium]|nr:AMP-binding protein [Alcaligenaceae bacterium]